MTINAMQRILLADYADGKYARILAGGQISDQALNEIDDPLFRYLLQALSGGDDRHTVQCACEQLIQSQRQILSVLQPMLRELTIEVQSKQSERHAA